MKKLYVIMIFSIVLLFFYSANSQIVINEIMFNPAGNEPEWIELFNNSDSEFSDSLIISDITKGYGLYLLDFPARSYCVLVKDTSVLKTVRLISDTALLIQVKIPTLNNDFDSLTLKLKTGEIIDSFYYKGSWSDKGFSLERISPDYVAINNDLLKQCKDSIGATCGWKNSNSINIIPDLPERENFVTVSPNPFSPNSNDKNICHINVTTVDKFDRLTIDIYNMNGAKIHTLAEETGQILQGWHKYDWDGKNGSGFTFQAGVYPIIVNLQNSQNGKSLQIKKLIVIAL